MNKLVRHWAESAALTTEKRYCLSVQQLNQIADELERIAELEARTLTVKLPGAWCEPGNRWIKEADTIAAIKDACGGAGIKLQIEGE